MLYSNPQRFPHLGSRRQLLMELLDSLSQAKLDYTSRLCRISDHCLRVASDSLGQLSLQTSDIRKDLQSAAIPNRLFLCSAGPG